MKDLNNTLTNKGNIYLGVIIGYTIILTIASLLDIPKNTYLAIAGILAGSFTIITLLLFVIPKENGEKNK